MPSQTNEQALESAIEKKLTGSCLEELKQQGDVQERAEVYRSGNGYYMGYANDFNTKYAIDEVRFWHFLATTQAEELAKIQKQNDWKLKILDRLDRMIKKYGVVKLLRKGLDVDDAHFTLFYVLPLASSSQSVKDNFDHNEFSVTRQVRYSLTNPREEIDMVLFINRLAFLYYGTQKPLDRTKRQSSRTKPIQIQTRYHATTTKLWALCGASCRRY